MNKKSFLVLKLTSGREECFFGDSLVLAGFFVTEDAFLGDTLRGDFELFPSFGRG